MAKRQAKAKTVIGPTRPGRLRIVAGKWRSRVLGIAEVDGLRPTAERIRETLFNWLAPDIAGTRCLDLYAGTGALGLEALSRGAKEAVFVERSRVALATLRKNISALETDAATLVHADAVRYLSGADHAAFDIVFLDPPFADNGLAELCRLLYKYDWVSDGGRVYLEQDINHAPPSLPESWSIIKKKTAGNVRYVLVGTRACDRNRCND